MDDETRLYVENLSATSIHRISRSSHILLGFSTGLSGYEEIAKTQQALPDHDLLIAIPPAAEKTMFGPDRVGT